MTNISTYTIFNQHQNHPESIRFALKVTRWKPRVENLIKPVVYGAFRMPNSQNGRKSIEKAIRFPLKVDNVSRPRKTMGNHWLQGVLQLTKK